MDFDRKVYKLEKGEVHIKGIQEVNAESEAAIVYAIGKRDKFEVYKDVLKEEIKNLTQDKKAPGITPGVIILKKTFARLSISC